MGFNTETEGISMKYEVGMEQRVFVFFIHTLSFILHTFSYLRASVLISLYFVSTRRSRKRTPLPLRSRR
jgi:hypothetical protein